MNKIYEYQQFYGVRLIVNGDLPINYAGKLAALNAATQCVRTTLNLKPASNAFTDPAGLTSTWSLPSADGIVEGSYNCPATITNATAVTPVLNFESGGVAAAVIDFGNNQQQMSFFLPCADWSGVCTTIANIWFQWGTRGAYTGLRRIYFTPQIDDVFLKTDGNDETGKAVAFRISQADIQGLIAWTPQINSRLPKGSNITIEMAYNGNGIMEYLSRLPTNPGYLIDIDPDLTDTGLDWKKPLGTGKTLWPAKANYTWTKANLALDPIYNAFSGPGNLAAVTSKFLWCSHTFTHEIFNNNSYSDTFKEVDFNFHLASKDLWGLDGQPFWSNKSMVTPGISGIFNGDALKALLDFGITGVVGDASRPKTVDPVRPLWWPITTNVADNGYAGMTVVPRQSLNIYFNTTNGPYNAQLYNNIYGTTKTFADILAIEVARNMRTLPMLSWQPAMFHQANLRNADMPNVTINGVSGKFSLMQQWVESLLGINATGVSIVGFNVTASKNCIAPVTLPPTVAIKDIILPAGATTEQIGVDSVTVWVPLVANAAPVQIKFGTLPVIPTTTTTTTTTSTTTSTTTTIPTPTTTSTTTTTPTTSTTPATSTISTASTKSTTSTSVSTSTISTSSTVTTSTIATSASISKTTTTSTLPACYPAWVSQDYDGPAKVSYLKNNYNVGAGGEGADAIPGGDTLWVLEGPCDFTTTPTTSTTPATSTISTASTKSTTSTSVSTSTISTSSTVTTSTIVTSASISKTTTTSTLPACYPAWVSQDYDGPAKVSYLKNNYNVGAGGEGADAIPGGDTLWVLEAHGHQAQPPVLATTSSSLTTVTKSASPTTSVVQTATVIPKTTTTAKLPACYAAWVNNIDYDEPANVSYLKKNYKVGAGGEGAGVVPGGDNLWLLEGDCV
ncbi:hypothetical protein BDR26DRAFT_857395 [Obelidium mucronatum]|nr:hypothetical protein BDR26DRAFT_857395 [Obelidium mucronatum]